MQITLNDDLRSRLAERAAESGFASVEEYVESLLRIEAGEEQVVSDDDLERLLLQRMEGGPGIELTSDFVKQFRGQIAARRSSGGTAA